jgi:hypothetical protein
MSWSEERRILEGWFQMQWAQGSAPYNAVGVPVEYPGMIFKTPDDGRPYMSMDIFGPTEGMQVQLGTPALYRYVGIIQFTINVPIGNQGGAGDTARRIADVLEALFRSRRFQTSTGVIRCRVPGYKPLGQQGARFVGVLSVPYLRDEIANIPPIVLLP